MFEWIANSEERGQVGIGTLIVFIAMVLVAAIAAGVLINTAGFLQSKGEQTGQESTGQVTNQIDVASKVGIVSGSGNVDTVLIEDASGNSEIAIDSGSTLTVSSTSAGDGNLANIDGTNGELAVQQDDSLKFTVDESVVVIQNKRTGAEIEVNTGTDALSLVSDSDTNDDTITFSRTYDDPTQGEVTLLTQTLNDGDSSSATSADLTTGQNTEQYIPLVGDGNVNSPPNNLIVSDGQTLTVGSSTTASSLSAGSGLIDVSAGDEIRFEVISPEEIRVTNVETGSNVVFDPFSDSLGPDSNRLDLTDGETTVAVNSGGSFDGLKTSAQDSNTLGADALLVNEDYSSGGGGVDEVNLVVVKGSGSDQINLNGTTITTVGPDGSSTLVYDADEAVQGESFTAEAIQDEDDSLPVMTDSDRFRLVVDPGTLENGETMILEATTQSGSTVEIRVGVPQTTVGKDSVQL